MKRRKFLATAGAAASATLLKPVSSIAGNRTDALPVDDWNEERKKLISQAQFGRKKGVSSSNGMAISSNPLVSNEAIKIMKQGGNAADAALAAAIVQSVVEPHMTTLTGVFSMLYYDAATGKTSYVNGSCNAPLATKKEDFSLLKLTSIAKTPQGALVPGFWGGYEESHKRFATMPLKTLMADAIRFAREGFETYPFLWGEIFVSADLIAQSADGREIYMPNNSILRPGDLVIQRKLADVLTRLQEEGSKYFYHGDFARKFAEVMKKTGGLVTEEDFARYTPLFQEPVKSTYRDFEVMASPAPDFGGQLMIEILNMAELYDFKSNGAIHESFESTQKAMQILGEVLTASFRERLMGTVTPVEKAISKSYAAERFQKMKPKPRSLMDTGGGAPFPPPPGSNHLTVVDAKGNVATVLHSVMSLPWTNTLYVEGVSICAAVLHYSSGVPLPGERINARICPSIIFKNNKPVLSSGSPSVSLMENILQNTINILDHGMLPEKSVHLPRFGGYSLDKPGTFLIENDYALGIIEGLEKLELKFDKVRPWQWNLGSFEGIYIDPATGMRHACADPRRAGQAFGY